MDNIFFPSNFLTYVNTESKFDTYYTNWKQFELFGMTFNDPDSLFSAG